MKKWTTTFVFGKKAILSYERCACFFSAKRAARVDRVGERLLVSFL